VEGARADAFADAVTLYRAGRIEEAIERVRRVLDLDPSDADALWNLGLWTAETGRHPEALTVWTRYREERPDDWRGRAKRIQALQALGREGELDREIEALRALRRAGDDADLVRVDSFCRDQFRVRDRLVMALERFDPAGPLAVVLEFVVLDAAGVEEGRYRLSSSDLDNALPWDDTPDSREHRRYRLARSGSTGTETVTWYEGRPPYERVRRDASRHLAAELRRHDPDRT
jgi:tetratricopeptide (TPR) repeat protein